MANSNSDEPPPAGTSAERWPTAPGQRRTDRQSTATRATRSSTWRRATGWLLGLGGFALMLLLPVWGVAESGQTAPAGGDSALSVPVGIALSVLLLALNGFFVAAEFALVKVRPTQLEPLVAEGSRTARLTMRIIERIDPYLSATQLGITISSLGLGWLGGPAVATVLDEALLEMDLAMAEPTLHLVSFIIAFSLISFLHIVVGEVAPKSLALARASRTALFVAWPMRITYVVLYPALVVLNTSSNLLLRLVGVEPVQGHGMAVSAEELRHIAHHSTTDGMLTAEQGVLLSNVFTFSDRVAREIMVPRNRVRAIDAQMNFEEAISFAVEHPHTRYPLVRDDLDEVIGVVHLKDLARLMVAAETAGDVPGSLASLAREIVYVPETMPAQRILQEFQTRRSHMAVVIDEHGGMSGIITLEDTLEELVGEIQDEFDAEDAPFEEVTGGYLIDGALLIDDLVARLGRDEIDSEADTVSGLIMELLGRIANVGDEVELAGFRLRVVEMEKMRIVRVLVRESIRLVSP